MTDDNTDDGANWTLQGELSELRLGRLPHTDRIGDKEPPVTVMYDDFEAVRIDHDGATYAVVETDAGLALERVEAEE